jgi:hypothetical protein
MGEFSLTIVHCLYKNIYTPHFGGWYCLHLYLEMTRYLAQGTLNTERDQEHVVSRKRGCKLEWEIVTLMSGCFILCSG